MTTLSQQETWFDLAEDADLDELALLAEAFLEAHNTLYVQTMDSSSVLRWVRAHVRLWSLEKQLGDLP